MELLRGGSVVREAGVDGANSRGVAITPSSTANTKGSWADIVAATARASDVLELELLSTAWQSDSLVDIATKDGASAEEIIINNLKVDRYQGQMLYRYRFPIRVRQGVALRARCQYSTGGATPNHYVAAKLGAGGPGAHHAGGFEVVDTYGANTADSGGTAIDPGGTANTKGSWVQLSGALPRPINHLVLSVGNGAVGRVNPVHWLLDIGVGAAASEVLVIPNIFLTSSHLEDLPIGSGLAFDCYIPAGSRLAARAQCSSTDANDRLFDLIAYGVS
ncbi:MAG TPA: hypothetical protein VLA52_07120 [Thermohalobaculum sp.]|nr:hypothetical protein [Thermohalobaculum sp.]